MDSTLKINSNMKRLLIAIVVNMVLFSSMSITAYAASGVVRAFFRTELVKGIYVEDGVAEDEILDDIAEQPIPESIEEPVPEVIDESTVADKSDDEDIATLVVEELEITTDSEEPIDLDEVDQINIDEKTEYETEVQKHSVEPYIYPSSSPSSFPAVSSHMQLSVPGSASHGHLLLPRAM